MSLSRFSVLAVFFMMIMSAFVAVPTYNVRAGEHEGGDDDDGGPYLNAFPTGSGGDPSDYEMSLDDSEGGANITVEATELTDGISYRIEWEISHLGGGSIAAGAWNFTPPPGQVKYFIGPDILNEEDFDPGCYVFTGWLFEHFQILIEMESWVFTLDYPIEACNPDDEGFIVNDDKNPDCYKNWVDNGQPVWSQGWPHYGLNITVEWPVNSGDLWYPEGGAITENQEPGLGHWWHCEADYEGDGGYEGGFDDLDITIEMIDLANWEVYFSGEYDKESSDKMREDIAMYCKDYEFTSDDNEVTTDCLDYMHYREDADFDCPSKDIDTCKELKACHDLRDTDDWGPNMVCNKKVYDAGDHDKMDELFVNLFDYEEGVTTSIKWADYMADLLDEVDNDEGTYEVATYGTDSLTVDVAAKYIITPEALYTWVTSRSFVCGNVDEDEIPFDSVNDGTGDCGDGSDEQWYDNDTETDNTDDCQQWNTANCTGEPVNWFDCHDGSKVWIYQVNDNGWDCPDGEDEGSLDEMMRWSADIYLYEGSFNPENTDNLIAASSYACDWEDSSDHSLGVYCGNNINIDLEVGDYTLVTASRCPMMWDEETDENYSDCNTEKDYYDQNHGDYNHTIENNGEKSFISGSVLESASHMNLSSEHYNIRNEHRENFVVYEWKEYEVGTAGFEGMIMSSHESCEDYDEDEMFDEDDCRGESASTYIYSGSFDPTNPKENVLYANDYHSPQSFWGEDHEDCCYTMLEVDLDPGLYSIVTTAKPYFNNFYNSVINYNYVMSSYDGSINEEWDGHFDSDNDRIHMPYAWDVSEQDYDDEWTKEYIDSMIYTATEYNHENLTADEAAATFTIQLREYFIAYEEWVEEMDFDDPTYYECPFDDLDCYDMKYTCMPDSDDYNPEKCAERVHAHCENNDDSGCEVFTDACNEKEIEEKICDYYTEEVVENSAKLNGIIGIESNALVPVLSEEGLIGKLNDNNGLLRGTSSMQITFDGVDETLESHVLTLPFGNSDYKEGYIVNDDKNPDCYKNWIDNGQPVWSQGWPHYGLNITVEWLANSGDLWYPEGGAIAVNEEPGHGHWWPCKSDYEGNGDYEGDGDYDDNLVWNVTVILADGYQIDSCDGCGNNALIEDGVATFSVDDSAADDVSITFSKIPEPEILAECDVTIKVDETGYAFDPNSVKITFGQTVCWQWTTTAEAHNVAQIAESGETTILTNGFYSGEASNTTDYRVTFDSANGYSDNTTYYYICEPHATMGMVGEVVVGTGSTDAELEEAIEESGLPSVSFIAGILVLVGAAGLRRRIH